MLINGKNWNDTPAFDDKVTGVLYCFADRRNGWYCFAHNAAGDQIGDAIYQFRKEWIVKEANELAAKYNVKAVRG